MSEYEEASRPGRSSSAGRRGFDGGCERHLIEGCAPDRPAGPSDHDGDAGYDFTASGVHIFTRDQDGYARLRWNVGVPFSTVKTVTFDWAGSDYGKNTAGQSTGLPGIYYDIDATGDGTIDCELLGERAYGGTNVWLNKGTSAYAASDKASDPTFCEKAAPQDDNTNGVGGSYYGALSSWATAFGSKSQVKYGGMLANGLVVDGVMSSVTFGDQVDTFSSDSSSVAGPQASDVTGRLVAKQRVHAVEMRFESDRLPAGRVQGAPLRWTVTVNGVKRSAYTLNAGQTASDRVVNHRRHGYKVVRVYKNGVKVATYVVAPRKRH